MRNWTRKSIEELAKSVYKKESGKSGNVEELYYFPYTSPTNINPNSKFYEDNYYKFYGDPINNVNFSVQNTDKCIIRTSSVLGEIGYYCWVPKFFVMLGESLTFASKACGFEFNPDESFLKESTADGICIPVFFSDATEPASYTNLVTTQLKFTDYFYIENNKVYVYKRNGGNVFLASGKVECAETEMESRINYQLDSVRLMYPELSKQDIHKDIMRDFLNRRTSNNTRLRCIASNIDLTVTDHIVQYERSFKDYEIVYLNV